MQPDSSAPRSAESCCPYSGSTVSFSATWPASSPAPRCSRDAAGPRHPQSRRHAHSPPAGSPPSATARAPSGGNPTLIAALAISFLSAVAQGLFLVLFVLFVLRSLHAGDQVVGLLRGVQAIGGVLGGLLVGTWAKAHGGPHAHRGRPGRVWPSLPAHLEQPRHHHRDVVVRRTLHRRRPAGHCTGHGLLTATQRASPRHVLGRVLSLIQAAQALGQGTGILLAGLLSNTVSLTALLNIQASCYLTCAVVAVMGFAPIARRTDSEALATAWTTTRARKPDRPTNAFAATQPPGVELGKPPSGSAVPLRARDKHCATTGERPA
jgi:hypothetical protein